MHVRFFLDYISSNAYLAWAALRPIAKRYGATVEPVPVLFAGLLEAHGQLGPAEVPAKGLWMWKNNLRKARLLGIELNQPAYHPFNPLLALRASSLPMSDEQRTRLVGALLTAVWVDGLHVSEPAVVERVATSVGLDGARIVADAAATEAKGRLRAQTEAAIAAGVFGVPSMLVGEELFWGYDDLPYMEHLLAGNDPIAGVAIPTVAPRASAARRRLRS